MHSLRTRFIAYLLLVALIPIALFYFFSLYSNEDVRKDRIGELLEVAYLVNTGINTFLSDQVKVLEVTAGNLAGKNGAVSDSPHLPVAESVAVAEQLLSVFDSYSLLLQLDRHGRLLAAAARSDAGERIDVSGLYEKDRSAEGWLPASIFETEIALSDIAAPLILKPVNTEQLPGISGQGGYVLPIIVPVSGLSNDSAGHVVAFMRMKTIERFLQQGAKALLRMNVQQSFFHLLDKDGSSVHAEYSQAGQAHLHNDGIDYSHEAIIESVSSILAVEAGQAGEEVSRGLLYRPENGEREQLVAYDKRSSAEDVNGVGWTVVIHLPTSQTSLFIQRVNHGYTIVALVSIVLVLGFGFLAGSFLTKPIKSIIGAMSRLREGSLLEEVEGLERKDEIGELANAFVSFQYFLSDRDYLLRKQVKQLQELMRARKEVDALMSSSTEPMLVVNAAGIIDWANAAAEKLFGYASGELSHASVAALVPARFKKDSEMIQTFMFQPEYRGMSDHSSIVGLHKEGDEIPLKISLSPLESINGVKALAVIHDLTQEEYYKDELRKLAMVAESTNNLVILTDKEHKIEWVNKAFETVTGYSSEEAIGQHPGALLQGKETDPETIATMGRAIQAGEAVRVETINYRKDGQPFWIDIDIHPVFDDQDIVHYVSIATDVTERHFMEDELRRARDVLEEQVEERTRELTRALEKADAAGRAQSAFLAMMSHEIRTPIHGIVGMVELLRSSSMRLKQLNMLNVIRDSSLSLQRIIDDILDYSKIEADKLSLEQASINLEYLVMNVCETLVPAADMRSICLVVRLDDSLPEKIQGDPVRIRQVLYNLVGNAIKFSEPSSIINIDVVVRDANDKHVAIDLIVKDAGIGMSAAVVDQLFTPFKQADVSTTRRYGGTGLGLSICQRLVTLMGGSIEVETRPGAGSTFRVMLLFPLELAASEQVPDLSGVQALVVCASETQGAALIDQLQGYITDTGAVADGMHGEAEVVVQAVHDMAQCGKPYDVVLLCQRAGAGHYYAIYQALSVMPEAERPKMVMLVPQHDENIYANVIVVDGNPLNINRLLRCIAVQAGRLDSCTPDDDETATKLDTAAVPSPPVGDAAEFRAGLMILVVEDNEINQQVITMQLSALGYEVMLAADGLEALKLWKTRPFDLVLTDCHMPEMDGFELTKHIRQLETATGSHTPIVAITANAMSEDRDKCLDSGMDDCLTKPIEMENLDRAIHKWLFIPVETSSDTVAGKMPEESAEETYVPVNPQILATLIGADIELCKPLLLKFRDASTPIINALIDAAEAARFDEIGALAHKLKSSAKSVGAERLAELCINMEQASKVGMGETLHLLLALELKDEFDKVKHYIDQL
ncbi:MAG: PAS domain S-box protein [Gammaproteobacteria bacterium]|nr:PAS domain S-box protein [Gammaproteobacteria bacterium]